MARGLEAGNSSICVRTILVLQRTISAASWVAFSNRRRHKRPSSAAVLRVAQLDAGRLDVELASMLQEQLRKAFALFRPVRPPC